MSSYAWLLLILIVGLGGPMVFLAGQDKGYDEGYDRGYDIGSGRVKYDDTPKMFTLSKEEPERIEKELTEEERKIHIHGNYRLTDDDEIPF